MPLSAYITEIPWLPKPEPGLRADVSRGVASLLIAAALAVALAACTTPVLKPALEVSDRFAAAPGGS
jgi:hypothetical protein